MIAADRADAAARRGASCSSSMRTGRVTHMPRATLARLAAAGRSRRRERRRHAAREPRRRPRAHRAADRGAARRLALARYRRRRPVRRSRLRRRRLPHAHRGSAAAAARSRQATGWRSARSPRRSRSSLGHPRLVRVRFDGTARGVLATARAARPADPVRAHRRAARALGRVDADRRRARRVRAAVGGIRHRVARRRRDARTRHPLRDADARRRHVVDGRCGARPSAAASTSGTGFPPAPRRPLKPPARRTRGSIAIGTTVVRAVEDAASRARRHPRDGAAGNAANRRIDAVAHRRCDRHGHARAREQPSRTAARIRRRSGAGRRNACAGARWLPDARVRRFDAGVCRRALATAARLASGKRRLRSMNAFSDAQCPSRAGRARRAA